jgi:hypothetical protein
MRPTHPSRVRVLFRVAAGPRQGYGHLVRATVLARELGVAPVVSLRGGQAARAVATELGCRLVDLPAAMAASQMRPSVLVVDDPSGREAAAWRRPFARAGVRVASVHDLGSGYCGADLAIDGSVTQCGRRPRGQALTGPEYAILRPARRTAAARRPAVLIALGGGPRARAAARLARAAVTSCPHLDVIVAGGFDAGRRADLPARATWLGPRRGLVRELSRVQFAVVGGGVTLYEACRAGTPAVGVAVVEAQRPTIRAFARRGAALDGGSTRDMRQAAAAIARLAGDARLRRLVGASGQAIVDGRGARRVAAALSKLALAAPSRPVRRRA